MHRIVIELFDHTSDAEADEFVRDIVSTFQPSGRVFATRRVVVNPGESITVENASYVLDARKSSDPLGVGRTDGDAYILRPMPLRQVQS